MAEELYFNCQGFVVVFEQVPRVTAKDEQPRGERWLRVKLPVWQVLAGTRICAFCLPKGLNKSGL